MIRFLGCLNADDTQDLLGLHTYMTRYGPRLHDNDNKEEMQEQLKDWSLTVPFKDSDDVQILCCPEDRECKAQCMHTNSDTVCEQCTVPVCRDCVSALMKPAKPNMPHVALANDLWMGYIPKLIYDKVRQLVLCRKCCDRG